ncbi:MAG: flavin reductase family protein [Alphaproteobacteria bacterium]|nr:flavin reductase family protein [Alphaproteobacteria bacterium]
MFYEIGKKHGLPHDPWKSCVVPRPIGWISTINRAGIANLAPYSFFNGCGDFPPHVMYAPLGQHVDGGAKDSLANVEETKEFVCNMCTYELRDAMNESSRHVGRGVNEFETSGLAMEPSQMVKPPRVKASPIHLECRYVKTVELPSWSDEYRNYVVFGQIIGVHIRDEVMTNGMVDIRKFKPIARLGYLDYTVVENSFAMPFPDNGAKAEREKESPRPHVKQPAE